MPSHCSWRKFVNSFIILFLVYLIVVPAFFFILDPESASRDFKKSVSNFLVKMGGIAMLISFVITLWSRKDPALRS